MADVMKTVSDRVLVGDWTGRDMLAGGAGRPIGPYAWDLLRRAGLRTSFSGRIGMIPMLVSGIERFFSRFGFLRSLDWSFAADGPDPVTLMLENEAAEPEYGEGVRRVRRGAASNARHGVVRPRARVVPAAASRDREREGSSDRPMVALARTMEAVVARFTETARAQVERQVAGILPALRLRSSPDQAVERLAGRKAPPGSLLEARPERLRQSGTPESVLDGMAVAEATAGGKPTAGRGSSRTPPVQDTSLESRRPAGASGTMGMPMGARPANTSRDRGFPFTYDVATLAEAMSGSAELEEDMRVSARSGEPVRRGPNVVSVRGSGPQRSFQGTATDDRGLLSPGSRAFREYTTIETPEGVFVALSGPEASSVAAAVSAIEKAGIRRRPGRTFGQTPLSGGMKPAHAGRGMERRTARPDISTRTPGAAPSGEPVATSDTRTKKTSTIPADSGHAGGVPARGGESDRMRAGIQTVREGHATVLATGASRSHEETVRAPSVPTAVSAVRPAWEGRTDAPASAGLDPRMPVVGTIPSTRGLIPGAVAERTTDLARALDWSVATVPVKEPRFERRMTAASWANVGERATAGSQGRADELSLPEAGLPEFIAFDAPRDAAETAVAAVRGPRTRTRKKAGADLLGRTASENSVSSVQGRGGKRTVPAETARTAVATGTREPATIEAVRSDRASAGPTLEFGDRTLPDRTVVERAIRGQEPGLAESFIGPLGRSVLPASSGRLTTIPAARESLTAAAGHVPVAGLLRGLAERDLLVSQAWAAPSGHADFVTAATLASGWNESSGVDSAALVALASSVPNIPERTGTSTSIPVEGGKRGRGTSTVKPGKTPVTGKAHEILPTAGLAKGKTVASSSRMAADGRFTEALPPEEARVLRFGMTGGRPSGRASRTSAPGIAVPTVLPVHAALAAVAMRDPLRVADTFLVSSRTTRGPRNAGTSRFEAVEAADRTLLSAGGPWEASAGGPGEAASFATEAVASRSAERRPGRKEAVTAGRTGGSPDRRGPWIVPAIGRPETNLPAEGTTVTGAFPISAGAGAVFLAQSPDAIPDGIVAPMGYSLATVAAPEVFTGLRTWGSAESEGDRPVSRIVAGTESGELISLLAPSVPEGVPAGKPASSYGARERGSRRPAGLSAGRPAGIDPSAPGNVSLRGLRSRPPTGGEVRISVSRRGAMHPDTKSATTRAMAVVSGGDRERKEAEGFRAETALGLGREAFGATLLTPIIGRETAGSPAAQTPTGGERTAGRPQENADFHPSVFESLNLLTPVSARAESPVAELNSESRLAGGRIPGLSLEAAETLLLVQRTLARALGALPTEGVAGDTLAGAPDAVTYLRGMGRRVPAEGGELLLAPERTERRLTETPEMEHVAVGGMETRAEGPEAAKPIRAKSTPVVTPGIPGGPANSRPETPDFDLITPSWSSKSAGMAESVGTHGLAASSLSALASGMGNIGAGPQYKGAMPLVTPALSAVASGAMMAEKESNPAETRRETQVEGKSSQTKAETKLDLDALAMEMADRIMKRIKRDKERRGFHG